MFVSEASAAHAVDRAAADIIPDQPVGFSLAWDRALADTRYRLQSVSEDRALVGAYDAYADDIWRATGQRLDNPVVQGAGLAMNRAKRFAPSFGWGGEAEGVNAPAQFPSLNRAERLAAFHGKVAELAAGNPDLPVRTPDDIWAGISEKAKTLKAEAEGGTRLGWSGLGSFLGSAQGSMEDPLNVFALAAGFGFEGGAAKAVTAARATLMERLGATTAGQIAITAGREGAINAAITAGIQPQVAGFNRAVGIDYGLGEQAAEVGGAFVGGAVLGGGLKGIGMGAKGLLDHWRGAKATGRVAEDADSRAAETVLHEAATREHLSPYPPTVEGDVAAARSLDEATRAYLSGEKLNGDALALFDRNQRDRIGELVDFARTEASSRVERKGSDAVWHTRIEDGRADDLSRAIKENIGQEVSLRNAVSRIDEDAIRHAMNEHPDLTKADLSRIPEVVRTGELVGVKNTADGLPGIEFRKLVDGQWLHVVEEVQKPGRTAPTLSFKTAYKNKGPKSKPGPEGPGPSDPRRPPSQGWPSPEASAAAPARYTSPEDGVSKPFAVVGAADPNIAPRPGKSKAAPPAPWPVEMREPSQRPETLVDYLRKAGGLKDEDGWLAHLGVSNKSRPGLISGAGMDLDHAALRAWEEGYFPEFPERPDMDSLRQAVADEVGGYTQRVRPGDAELQARWDAHRNLLEEVDRAGVNPSGKTFDEVTAEIQAHYRAEAHQAAEFDRTVSDFLNKDLPALKAELDPERALVSEWRGRLMGDDMAIPANLIDDEGRAVTASARELMDAADDEFAAWDAAFGCVTKF